MAKYQHGFILNREVFYFSYFFTWGGFETTQMDLMCSLVGLRGSTLSDHLKMCKWLYETLFQSLLQLPPSRLRLLLWHSRNCFAFCHSLLTQTVNLSQTQFLQLVPILPNICSLNAAYTSRSIFHQCLHSKAPISLLPMETNLLPFTTQRTSCYESPLCLFGPPLPRWKLLRDKDHNMFLHHMSYISGSTHSL